jgi:hypothetical protein
VLSRDAPPVVLRRSRVTELISRDAPPVVLRRSREAEVLSRDGPVAHLFLLSLIMSLLKLNLLLCSDN